MLERIFKNNWPLVKEYLEALLIIIPIAFLIRSFGYGLYRVPTGSMEPTMLVGERFFADKLTPLFSKPKHGDIITFNDPSYPYSKNPVKYSLQRYIWGPCNLTKRIIAIPGDHIKGVVEGGKPVVYVNGKKLNEPYVNAYPLIPIDAEKEIWRTYVPEIPFDEQPYYKMNSSEVHNAQKWFERRGMPITRQPHTPLPEGQGSDVYELTLGENQYWVMGDNRLGSSDSRDWGPLDGKYIHGKIIYRLWSIESETNWWIVDLILHPLDFWKRIRWDRSFKRLNKAKGII